MDKEKLLRIISKESAYAYALGIVLALLIKNLITEDEYDLIVEDLKIRFQIGNNHKKQHFMN